MVKSMRSRKYTKMIDARTKTKIRKKKQGHKSLRFWGLDRIVSVQNLEKINETFRISKTQRAEGRHSWELVPKDSIEVYKERRRKRETRDAYVDKHERTKKGKTRTNEVERKMKKKPVKKVKKNKRRSQSYTPQRSQTSCSSSSITCASASDMEQD